MMEKNYLDYRRIVQSIMAYKMADVDNITLIYSFYESLSEFICNYVNEISNDIKQKMLFYVEICLLIQFYFQKLTKRLARLII